MIGTGLGYPQQQSSYVDPISRRTSMAIIHEEADAYVRYCSLPLEEISVLIASADANLENNIITTMQKIGYSLDTDSLRRFLRAKYFPNAYSQITAERMRQQQMQQQMQMQSGYPYQNQTMIFNGNNGFNSDIHNATQRVQASQSNQTMYSSHIPVNKGLSFAPNAITSSNNNVITNLPTANQDNARFNRVSNPEQFGDSSGIGISLKSNECIKINSMDLYTDHNHSINGENVRFNVTKKVPEGDILRNVHDCEVLIDRTTTYMYKNQIIPRFTSKDNAATFILNYLNPSGPFIILSSCEVVKTRKMPKYSVEKTTEYFKTIKENVLMFSKSLESVKYLEFRSFLKNVLLGEAKKLDQESLKFVTRTIVEKILDLFSKTLPQPTTLPIIPVSSVKDLNEIMDMYDIDKFRIFAEKFSSTEGYCGYIDDVIIGALRSLFHDHCLVDPSEKETLAIIDSLSASYLKNTARNYGSLPDSTWNKIQKEISENYFIHTTIEDIIVSDTQLLDYDARVSEDKDVRVKDVPYVSIGYACTPTQYSVLRSLSIGSAFKCADYYYTENGNVVLSHPCGIDRDGKLQLKFK